MHIASLAILATALPDSKLPNTLFAALRNQSFDIIKEIADASEQLHSYFKIMLRLLRSYNIVDILDIISANISLYNIKRIMAVFSAIQNNQTCLNAAFHTIKDYPREKLIPIIQVLRNQPNDTFLLLLQNSVIAALICALSLSDAAQHEIGLWCIINKHPRHRELLSKILEVKQFASEERFEAFISKAIIKHPIFVNCIPPNHPKVFAMCKGFLTADYHSDHHFQWCDSLYRVIRRIHAILGAESLAKIVEIYPWNVEVPANVEIIWLEEEICKSGDSKLIMSAAMKMNELFSYGNYLSCHLTSEQYLQVVEHYEKQNPMCVVNDVDIKIYGGERYLSLVRQHCFESGIQEAQLAHLIQIPGGMELIGQYLQTTKDDTHKISIWDLEISIDEREEYEKLAAYWLTKYPKVILSFRAPDDYYGEDVLYEFAFNCWKHAIRVYPKAINATFDNLFANDYFSKMVRYSLRRHSLSTMRGAMRDHAHPVIKKCFNASKKQKIN